MEKNLFVSHRLGFSSGGTEFGILSHALSGLPTDSLRDLWGIVRVGIGLAMFEISSAWLIWRKSYGLIDLSSISALRSTLIPCLVSGKSVIYQEGDLLRLSEQSVFSITDHRMLHRVTQTVSIMEVVKDQFLSSGSESDLPTAVHNGIDPEPPISLDDEKSSLSLRDRPGLSIVQIANLFDWKGQDVGLEFFGLLRETLPDSSVVLYGHWQDQNFQAKLDEMVKTLDLTDGVEFAGLRTDLMERLTPFNCLAVASQKQPLGLRLREALRPGGPLFATHAGVLTEVVPGEVDGLLFEAGDAAGFASVFERISEYANRFWEDGLRVVGERFSFARQLETLRTIFENHTQHVRIAR
jgi:glycosyltransferase involved in cell wall biosynthesis